VGAAVIESAKKRDASAAFARLASQQIVNGGAPFITIAKLLIANRLLYFVSLPAYPPRNIE
jgi:hypothetical protein